MLSVFQARVNHWKKENKGAEPGDTLHFLGKVLTSCSFPSKGSSLPVYFSVNTSLLSIVSLMVFSKRAALSDLPPTQSISQKAVKFFHSFFRFGPGWSQAIPGERSNAQHKTRNRCGKPDVDQLREIRHSQWYNSWELKRKTKMSLDAELSRLRGKKKACHTVLSLSTSKIF